jgi:hypothetical protein
LLCRLPFGSSVFSTSGVANVMCCQVHPNSLAVMVIVLMLCPHAYFIVISILITYVKYEFQLEIIMIGLK